MPVTFTCDSARSGDVEQIVFSLMREQQPNYVYFKLEREVMRELFNADVLPGDVWALRPTLVSRVGTNGKRRG